MMRRALWIGGIAAVATLGLTAIGQASQSVGNGTWPMVASCTASKASEAAGALNIVRTLHGNYVVNLSVLIAGGRNPIDGGTTTEAFVGPDQIAFVVENADVSAVMVAKRPENGAFYGILRFFEAGKEPVKVEMLCQSFAKS